MNASTQATTTVMGSRNGIRDLHVKAIPEAIWVRARCNATKSGMSFKDYVIRILGACQPVSGAPAQVQEGCEHATN